MYNQLKNILKKPETFEFETRLELWTKPHLAQEMLKTHLNPHTDRASRKPEFIQETVKFIQDRLGDGPQTILDLGCGPGLYTGLLSRAKYDVYGMDFSELALDYARNNDPRSHYTLGNYVTDDLPSKADLVTLIYCDYCALNPKDRRTLLTKVAQTLKPGGLFAFDVHTLVHFDGMQADNTILQYDQAGFFSPSEHIVVHQRHLYPSSKVSLDRFDVYSPQESYTLYNWLQHFSLESLEVELASCGLEIVDYYDDFTGKPYTGKHTDMMVIARVITPDFL